MQTLANTTQLNSGALPIHDQDSDDQKLILKGLYRQLFKENRDFDFFHNSLLDSKYLNGDFTVRDLVREFICSDMYTNYILAMNSNYRFVQLCFERVLGREATQAETFRWWLQKAGAVLIVAGCLELGRIFLTLAWGAVTSGSL